MKKIMILVWKLLFSSADTQHVGSIRRFLVSASIWAFVGRFMTFGSTLISGAILARLLTPAEFGTYFLAMSIIAAVMLITLMGIPSIIVRFIAESGANDNYGRARSVIYISFRVVILTSGTIAFVIALFGDRIAERLFDSPLLASITVLVAIVLVIRALLRLFGQVFRGFHDIRLSVILCESTPEFATMMVFVGMWLFHRSLTLDYAFFIVIVANTIVLFTALLLLRRRLQTIQHSMSMRAIEVLAPAWPLMIASLMYFVLTDVDIWIIGIYRSAPELALYSSALKLTSLVMSPLSIATAIIPPVVARLYTQGRISQLQRTLRTTATLSSLPSLIALCCFFLIGKDILRVVYGDFYEASYPILLFISLGGLVNVWAGSCGVTLVMTGNQRTMMIITVIIAIFTTVGGLVVVMPWGIVGVSAVMSIGMIVQNIAMVIAVKLHVGVWTTTDFLGAPRMIRDVSSRGLDYLRKELA